MRKKIFYLWEKGYLYLLFSFFIYILFALSSNVGVFDWVKEIFYFQYIKESLTVFHSWPFIFWKHLGCLPSYPALNESIYFVANPETMLFSPFLPLLFFLDGVRFIKIVTLLFWGIGLAGLFCLKKKLQWTDEQFRIFGGFFMLSPIIIQHLAIGYTPWLNLFFFPWLIFFLAEARFWISCLALAVVESLILLQGGVHIFIWFTLLLLFYLMAAAVFEGKWLNLFKLPVIYTVVAGLAMVRIGSTWTAYQNFGAEFCRGYNFINFLFWAFCPPVLINMPGLNFFNSFYAGNFLGVNCWDAGIFWGLSLPIFLIVLIKFKKFHDSGCDFQSGLSWRSLLISAVLLLFLSFFGVYEFLTKSLGPAGFFNFLKINHYPFRLAIVSYFVFSLLAAEYWKDIWGIIQKWWVNRSAWLSRFSGFFMALVFYFFFGLLGGLFFLGLLVRLEWALFWLLMFSWGSQPLVAEEIIGKYYLYINYILLVLYLIGAAILYKKIGQKIRSFFSSRLILLGELLLFWPLFFASFMWLGVATGINPAHYSVDKMHFPIFKESTQYPEADFYLKVSPSSLILSLNPGVRASGFASSVIPFKDSKFLKVASGNARLTEAAGYLKIAPSDEQPVVLKFRQEQFFWPYFYISLCCWLVLLALVLVIKFF